MYLFLVSIISYKVIELLFQRGLVKVCNVTFPHVYCVLYTAVVICNRDFCNGGQHAGKNCCI